MARQATKQAEQASRLRNFLSFVGWVGLLVALGLFLNAVFGPPHLPKPLPTWRDVWSTLGSSEVPTQAIIYFCLTMAWLLLGYLAAITILRLAVDLLFAISSGSAAARRLLTWSNLITIPIVRRLVDGMIVTVTVVHLLGPELRPTPALAAPAALVLNAERRDPWSGTSHLAPVRLQPQRVEAAEDGKTVVYLVKKGDTLRGIAQRFLGDEARWTVIWEANRDKPMGRGLRFTSPDLIYPGWELAIPVGETPQYEVYTVVEGDSLWGIAEEQLGDGLKWRTIWELNEGRVMNDGIGFGDPRLIHPGWQLFLPKPPRQAASPAQAPAAPAPEAPSTPAAQPTSPAPTNSQTPSQPTAVADHALTPAPPTATPPPATPRASVPLMPTASAQSPTPTASGTSPLVVLPDGRIVAATFGVALVGLLGYLYRRRRGDEPGEDALDGYTPGPFVSALRQRFTEGLETNKVAIVANRLWMVLGALDEQGLWVLSCLEERDRLVFHCHSDPEQAKRLADSVAAISAELRCRVRVEQHGDGSQLALVLSRLPYRTMLDAVRPDYHLFLPLLVPLGVDDFERAFHVNLAVARALLVAGLPGGGADTLLQSLLVSLAAQTHFRQASLVLIGDPKGVLAELKDLPHLARLLTDRDDQARVAETMAVLRAELGRRMGLLREEQAESAEAYNAFRDLSSDYLPYVVVAIEGLEHVLAHPGLAGEIATLCQDGPRYGLIVVATTEACEKLPEPVLAAFPSRVALRLLDDGQSIRVLGERGAETLEATGEVLLRQPGQETRRLRAFRIEPDDIAECVRLMAAAHGERAAGLGESAEEGGSVPDDARPAGKPDAEPGEESTGDPAGGGNGEDPGSSALGLPEVTVAGTAPISSNGHGSPAPGDPDAASTDAGAPGSPSGINLVAGMARPLLPEEEEARRLGLIRVYCLGGFRVFRGDVELTRPGEPDAEPDDPGNGGGGSSHKGRLSFRKKARELLAYFVTYPHSDLDRERVQEALWPGADPEQGQRNFNHHLWIVRQHLSGSSGGSRNGNGPTERYVLPDHGVFRLQAELFWIDALAFEAYCKQADAVAAEDPARAAALREQAVALYQGDYLGHADWDWAQGKQTWLRQIYVRTLVRLTSHYTATHDLGRAIDLLRKALEIDRCDEGLNRRLLRLYASTSNWGAVVEHYRAFTEELKRELGIEPERRTQELYQKLLAQRDQT